MILLTGGTGFLGKYLLEELLSKGHKVRALARNPNSVPLTHPGIEWVEGDIMDVPSLDAAMEGVKKVIHSAAVVSFWPRRYEEMMRVNVGGTANVVNLCLGHGVEKLVYVSSIAALGRQPGMGIITEETKWKDNKMNSQYAISKYLGEMQVHRGVAEDLKAVIVNPSLIVGPGRNWEQGTQRLFTLVYNGLRFYNPGGTAIVSAADVARASVMLLDQGPIEGEKFILSADNVEYKTFFKWVAASLGKSAPGNTVAPWMAMLAGTLSQWRANLTGKEPLITRETARISARSFLYDGSLITRTLPFSYSSLEAAVMETGKAFLQDHANKA